MHGLDGGSGWNGGWGIQNSNSDPTGYRIVGDVPLSYSTLYSTPNYMTGGISYLSGSRKLDLRLTGPYQNYLTDDNQSVGKPGTTIWVSVLARKNLNNDDLLRIKLGNDFEFGFLGDKTEGSRVWSMQATGAEKALMNIPVVTGLTVLAVLKFDFGTTSKISLYIDPITLGGTAPAQPDASIETAASVRFASFYTILGAGRLNHADLDEIYVK